MIVYERRGVSHGVGADRLRNAEQKGIALYNSSKRVTGSIRHSSWRQIDARRLSKQVDFIVTR